jgi:Ni/Fe-hydrogenase 1 B-type cytochrome subunit
MNAPTSTYRVSEAANPLARGRNLVRVYVWEKPVRIAHWVIFFCVFILGFTGYYIYKPFIISRDGSVFLMAQMRFVHEVTAFVFISAVLVRSYWWFTGTGLAHWTGFISSKRWWRQGLWRQLKYYFFLRSRPSTHLGHNPLAAVTYMCIWALIVIEIITGMALLDYVNGLGHGALHFFFGWVFWIVGVHYVREAHFLIMFAFLAFMIHHVYSAVLISVEEGSGLMDGIFSGYKFFPARCIETEPALRPEQGRDQASELARALAEEERLGEKQSAGPTPPSGGSASSPR